ncbi:O-antigen ligase family protein [Halorubellus sp. PRR65]|uniref:O-antigen ligase family protein n=1 Tax=Halorubellus sp. PRR65 TaxID=3098148 RepID=UPI002B2611B5|nr:O-antigen ligase family protein [Halorubellus sp. PRR65]
MRKARLQKTYIRIWTILLLIAPIAAYSYLIPTVLGYSIVAVVYTGFLLYCVSTEDVNLVAQRYIYLVLLVIFALYSLNLLIDMMDSTASARDALRVVLYLPVLVVNLIILPRKISLSFFLSMVSRTSGLLVLLGLIPVITGPMEIGPVTLVAWRGDISIPVVGKIPMIRSVLQNPNQLGVLAAVGAGASLEEGLQQNSFKGWILFVLNSFGLYLTTARGSILLLIIITSLYLIFYFYGKIFFRNMAILAMIGSIIIILAVWAAASGIIPLPINFTGRPHIWDAALRAFGKSPIIGYGAGDTGTYLQPYVIEEFKGRHTHNSYFRLFLTAGAIGGLSYILLITKTILHQYRKTVTGGSQDILLFSIVLGIGVSQFFEAYSLFGIGLTTFIASVLYGFGQKEAT